MKTCSVCGLHVEDDYLYCWEDGTRLNETRVVLPLPGRSPGTLPIERIEPPSREAEEAEGQTVLYCPVCSGAFPLTFAACPVDQVPLTAKLFSRRAAPKVHSEPAEEEPVAQTMTAGAFVQFSDGATNRLRPSTTEILSRDETEEITDSGRYSFRNETEEITDSERYSFRNETEEITDSERYSFRNETEEITDSGRYSLRSFTVRLLELRDRAKDLWKKLKSSLNAAKRQGRSRDWSAVFGRPEEIDPPDAPKGMRLAARATAIALILVTLAGVYIIYSQVTRTSTRSSRGAESNMTQPPSPLIATPQAAREYRAESELPTSEGIEKQGSEATIEGTPRLGDATFDSAPRTALAAPARSSLANLAAGSLDSRRAVGGGRFTSQLVRVRSYKSPTGYRYTLTFTLYEQAGRPMQWERLSIVTHSANGETHAESLPFQYVQAGSGALTFTVNVEMAGASEADWRGHISCTSVGADNSGRPLRASFGADVAP